MTVNKEELKEVVQEVMQEIHSPLTEDEILAVKTVSTFLSRIRNAAGNFIVVLLFVVGIMGVGGVLYLCSGGNINLFKLFGIGS